MKKSRAVFSGIAVALISSGFSANAQEFVHTFTNPNFGGNPFVGTYLFGMAEAQRTATVENFPASGGQNGQIPGIGGDSVGGPTIVIPIGDIGPDDLEVDATDSQ